MVTLTESSPSRKPIAVFHATVAGIAGCVFQLGNVVYFSPMDDPSCYVVTDTTQLLVTAEIPEPMAAYVRTDIEQKLRHGSPVSLQGGAL